LAASRVPSILIHPANPRMILLEHFGREQMPVEIHSNRGFGTK
jgi:hypothetical protein